ncbi:MAG TPA: YHS domain-containing protein [Candidatus Omnitrophota bacterium]|nr:YHS domain-containing protein [Candidatus Omnitrophota bacterium]
MKKIISIGVMFFCFLSLVSISWAQEPIQKTEPAVETPKPVEAGNKICPVSGEKIDEKSKETYEYKGKIYNFCCPACIDEFKKDPEKYIKKVEEELEAEHKEHTEEKQGMEMMQEPATSPQGHAAHEGHHH